MTPGAVADVTGKVIEDTVVPPCEPWSSSLNKSDVLRLIDLEGQQAVDFLCYNLHNREERYNAANTIKLNRSIYLGQGAALWSVRAREMMTILQDTCGLHDTLAGCCSAEIDKLRYGIDIPRGCQQNFETELARHGMGEKDIVANINFFMYVPVAADGHIAIADGVSKPGDYVDLRAEMDLLVVLSNCPQQNNPAAGFKPTPIRAIVYRPN